jgi:hypothetical protein
MMTTTQEMKLDEQWAVEEFAHIELSDARLNQRCQELAIALGQQPNAPINQACEDWADLLPYRTFVLWPQRSS